VLDVNRFLMEQVVITDAGGAGPEQNYQVQKAEINFMS